MDVSHDYISIYETYNVIEMVNLLFWSLIYGIIYLYFMPSRKEAKIPGWPDDIQIRMFLLYKTNFLGEQSLKVNFQILK